MFSWVTSFWSKTHVSGPARNAPNNGENIKTIIDNKPPTVVSVTQKEIENTIKNLRKTVINEPYKSAPSSLELELASVFELGNSNYFELMRIKRKNLIEANINISNNQSIEKIDIDTTTNSEKNNDFGDKEIVIETWDFSKV